MPGGGAWWAARPVGRPPGGLRRKADGTQPGSPRPCPPIQRDDSATRATQRESPRHGERFGRFGARRWWARNWPFPHLLLVPMPASQPWTPGRPLLLSIGLRCVWRAGQRVYAMVFAGCGGAVLCFEGRLGCCAGALVRRQNTHEKPTSSGCFFLGRRSAVAVAVVGRGRRRVAVFFTVRVEGRLPLDCVPPLLFHLAPRPCRPVPRRPALATPAPPAPAPAPRHPSPRRPAPPPPRPPRPALPCVALPRAVPPYGALRPTAPPILPTTPALPRCPAPRLPAHPRRPPTQNFYPSIYIDPAPPPPLLPQLPTPLCPLLPPSHARS